MKEYPFKTAYTQARELYGLTLEPDEFETIGMIGWDKIGTKRYNLYKYVTTPVKVSDGTSYVLLPTNCDMVEAVTYGASFKDKKTNTNALNVPGTFVVYRLIGNRMLFDNQYDSVNILYKGIIVDEEGLPFLNEKELDAIAGFCMFVNTRKKAAVSRDPGLWNTVQYWENTWRHLCTQARVPDYVSQNQMDEVLDVSTNWDRKRFGHSFKPIV